MTWPRRIYVATVNLGVYYTDDFVDPGTQPTWTAVNAGLPTLDCREFWLDPYEPAERQYVMLEATRTIYRRTNGGNWSSILTEAQAAEFVNPPSADALVGFCVDPATEGRLFATYAHTDLSGSTGLYVFRSNDRGTTWELAAQLYYGIHLYGYGIPRAVGDSVFVPASTGAGGSYSVFYSDDGGDSWSSVLLAAYGYVTPISVNPLTGLAYVKDDILSVHDLAYVADDGSSGNLQSNISLERNDVMWFDPADADHQRLLSGAALYCTTDSWTSVNSPSSIGGVPLTLAPWAGDDTDQIIVSLTIEHGSGADSVIGVLYGESDVTPQGIAGAACGSSPYTDSIPYTCGGVCSMGIQAVDFHGAVYTYAVAMPGYTGTERGTPMPGDRASWETGQTHADDWAEGDSHHAALSLSAEADDILDLDGQIIGLDTQIANTVLAGPTSGADAVPTFRALVEDDLPEHVHAPTSEIVVDNPHPGTVVDECVARAYVDGKLYWSSHRAQGALTDNGYEYAYNVLSEANAEIQSQAGKAYWNAVYNPDDGLIYAVGQHYADGVTFRAGVITIDPATGTVTAYALNAAGEATSDCNELISLLDDVDNGQLIAGERGGGGLTAGSDYPNGGGLWTIPKATIANVASYTRVYEDSTAPTREWTSICKIGSQYIALLCTYSDGKYVIQRSTDLTNWTVDVDGTGLALNAIRGALIYHAGLDRIYAATVNSSRQVVLRWYDGSVWSSQTFLNLAVPALGSVMFGLGVFGPDLIMTISEGTGNTHDVYLLSDLNEEYVRYTPLVIDVAGWVGNPTLVKAGANLWYGTCTPGGLNRIQLWDMGGVDTDTDTDELAAVSANDTTPGYLNGKLVAGANITLTENNDGGDETLTVAATVPAAGKYRQFVYIVTAGDFSFVDVDGNPVMALQDLE